MNFSVGFSPVRIPKKAEVVARRIVASIVERRLAPGTVMPSEVEMLAEFQVARSTLREALRLLETQGVLSLQAGRSPEVRQPTPDQLVNSLTLLLQFHGGTFETLLRARAMFEPAIAAEAARRRRPEQLALLRANLDLQRSDGLNDHDRIRGELEFHRLLAECSGNALAALIVATVTTALNNEMGDIHIDHSFAKDLQYHEDIVEAVSAGDSARAESTMREHIERLLAFAGERYPTLLARPIHWM